MTETKPPSIVARVLAGIVLGILLLMPFHALLTVGLSQIFGHYTLLRLWKEVFVVIAVLLAVVALWKNLNLRKKLFGSALFWSGSLYLVVIALWSVVGYVTQGVTTKSLGYGLISDARFVMFMLVALVAASLFGWLYRYRIGLALAPATIVILFGLLQQYVLPSDALKHIGYGPETIRPYQRIDKKDEYVRIISTLRGANPLGAYLLVVLSVLATLLRRRTIVVAAAMLLGMSVLFASQSRSAWIGYIVALGVVIVLLLPRRLLGRVFAVAGIVAVLVAGGIYAGRNNDYVQNTLFHTDETSQAENSSNEDRLSAIQTGVADILREPLGRGVGTAGPASIYNDDKGRIAENYYLQIGQEMGIIGLAAFVALQIVVAAELFRTYRRDNDGFALALLAAFVGLVVVNMLNHAWADDTLAYIWWGLAGIALSQSRLLTWRQVIRPKHAKD